LFSDTGGERPDTYAYLKYFSDWLVSRNFPPITIVKYKTKDGVELTLEQDCANNQTIPSIAFGWKTCSQKYKTRPQDKYLKQKYGDEPIQMWIGFDSKEGKRVKANPNKGWENYFPLIEWGYDRDRCIEKIKEMGLNVPIKSSCFFCPNMRKHEILALPDELKERVIAMEKSATKLIELKGLGRNKSWTSVIEADRSQQKIDWDEQDWHQPSCECID
jgi:hypothetical protein